jgi:hypothetical protein
MRECADLRIKIVLFLAYKNDLTGALFAGGTADQVPEVVEQARDGLGVA